MTLPDSAINFAALVLVVAAIVVLVLTWITYSRARRYLDLFNGADIVTAAAWETDGKALVGDIRGYLWATLAVVAIIFALSAILVWNRFGMGAGLGLIAVGAVVAYMAVFYLAYFGGVGRGLFYNGTGLVPNQDTDAARSFISYVYSFIVAFVLFSIAAIAYAAYEFYSRVTKSSAYSKVASDSAVEGAGRRWEGVRHSIPSSQWRVNA